MGLQLGKMQDLLAESPFTPPLGQLGIEEPHLGPPGLVRRRHRLKIRAKIRANRLVIGWLMAQSWRTVRL